MAFTSEEIELFLQVAKDGSVGSTFSERLEAIMGPLSVLIPNTSLSVILLPKETSSGAPGHLFYKNGNPADLVPYVEHYIKFDPMAPAIPRATGQSYVLSDFLPRNGYGRDAFTSELLPKLNVRYLMGCSHRMPDGDLLSIAIHRARGLRNFTTKEREALRLISPTVARAVFGTLLQEKLDAGATTPGAASPRSGAILFDALGDIVHADEGAVALVRGLVVDDGLPTDLLVAEVRRLLGDPAATSVEQTLPLDDGRWVRIRLSALVSQGKPGAIAVLEVLAPNTPELFHALCSRAALTPREREVAALAVRGFGNREIARELAISAVTVNIHLGHVYSKTGAPNRTELAAIFLGGHGPGRRV